MSVEFLTVAMFVSLIVAIIFGHPLAYTLAAVATLFGLIDNGFNFNALFNMFANNAWGVMENYVLVAIPLFILMAQLLDRSKVSDKLFEAMYVVLGSIKGGLGLAVVMVCTVFAATTGIIGASVVAMGLLATPALLRKNYQKEMTSGIICAAGTLGILIPPSIHHDGHIRWLDRTQGDHCRQPICRGYLPGHAAGRSLFRLYSRPLQHQP